MHNVVCQHSCLVLGVLQNLQLVETNKGIGDMVVVPKAINQPLPPHLTLTEDDALYKCDEV